MSARSGHVASAADLVERRLGPVTLRAPRSDPRQLHGEHGHLWQWVGDGDPLLTLVVAVRRTVLGRIRDGVQHHLRWELRRVVAGLDDPGAATVGTSPVSVAGAVAAAVVVDGRREGLEVRHGLVVSTEADLMHVVQVAVARSRQGEEMVDQVLHRLEAHPWLMPHR